MCDVTHLLGLCTDHHTQGLLGICVMNDGGGWQGSHVRSTHCRPWPEKGPPGHSLSHAPCAVEISTYQPWRWATHSHPIPQGQARWLLHSLAQQTQEARPEQISFKISVGPLHPSAEPLLGLLPGLCLLPSCAHVYGCMCACTWVGGDLHVLVCVCVCGLLQHTLQGPCSAPNALSQWVLLKA